MKKLIFPSILLLMLTSCNFSSNQTDKGTDSADSICVADTTVQLDASNDVDIQIKTYADHKLFLYSYKPRHIYHENSVSIDWPEDGHGFDLKALQDTLKSYLKNEGTFDNPHSFVSEYAKNSFIDTGFDWDTTEVPERIDDDEETMQDDNLMQFDTDCTFELTCRNINKKQHNITFSIYSYSNLGCGLGSCTYPGYDFVVFDYQKNRTLEFEDIFTDQKKVAKELCKQRLDEEGEPYPSDELIGLNNIDEISAPFYFADNIVYFVFAKYEISYGAAGCPSVGIDVTKCPQLLTDYAKEIFGIK